MPSPVHPYSDYGVSLRTLRSARGWLGLLLFICVTWQFVGFSLMYWTTQPYLGAKTTEHSFPTWSEAKAILLGKHPTTAPAIQATGVGAAAPATAPTTEEGFVHSTPQSRELKIRDQWNTTYTILVPVTQLSALISVASQSIIIFITLLIMLIAQAPGVAQMTKSLIWSVLLLFIFLPWQYFVRDFPIPGVIYSYSELLNYIAPHVHGAMMSHFDIFKIYARFLFWPAVGLFVLLITAERYRAGVMISIGHPLQSILQAAGINKPAVVGPLGVPNKKIG
jgi:hypothetical protein